MRNRSRVLSFLALSAVLYLLGASATAATPEYQRALASGKAVDVIVEFEHGAADREAHDTRLQRGLVHDDAQIRDVRSTRYAATRRQVESAASGADARQLRNFANLPLSVWHLSAPAALARLRAHPLVKAVYDDLRVHAVGTASDLALIEQPAAQAAGGTGAGTMVVVIDAGIDLTNPAFGTCPAAGASGCRVLVDQIYYPGTTTDVSHGTNVSGVAAEVASAANLAMHNVFNGAGASSTDMLTAIDWSITNQATYNIASVNMSLGNGVSYTASTCPNVMATAAANAASAGITIVAASGNDGFSGGINWPACTPGIVSVGAVYDTAYSSSFSWSAPANCTDTSPVVDQVACFTDVGPGLTLFAPGINVVAAGITMSGTSQASPHAAGSVAVLRAAYPAESLSQTLTRLTSTGTLDTRSGYTVPRIDVYKAQELGTALALSGSGPSVAAAGTNGSYTLTVTNNGPLAATNVVITDTLPSLATFVSASTRCSASGATVTCQVGSLAVNASASFTIQVHWSGSGAVYDTASVSADQIDSTPTQAGVAFGTPPATTATEADVPMLPPWAMALLAGSLLVGVGRFKQALL